MRAEDKTSQPSRLLPLFGAKSRSLVSDNTTGLSGIEDTVIIPSFLTCRPKVDRCNPLLLKNIFVIMGKNRQGAYIACLKCVHCAPKIPFGYLSLKNSGCTATSKILVFESLSRTRVPLVCADRSFGLPFTKFESSDVSSEEGNQPKREG